MVGANNGNLQQIVTGAVTDENLGAIFNANGLQSPVAYDFMGAHPAPAKNAPSMKVTWRLWRPQRAAKKCFITKPTLSSKSGVGNFGFFGIGVANGQSMPGRQVRIRPFTEEKAARIEGEAWQTSGPVITDAEAIKVLYGIQ